MYQKILFVQAQAYIYRYETILFIVYFIHMLLIEFDSSFIIMEWVIQVEMPWDVLFPTNVLGCDLL